MLIKVKLDDISLATASGQKLLDQRIERAVRIVCRLDAPTTGSHILPQERREFQPRGAYSFLRHPVYLSFLGLVWFLFLLDLSLGSEAGFEKARQYLAHPLVKLVLLGFTWAFLHHLCAGIRYLFLDVLKGIDLPSARATSFVVFAASLLLTVVFGAKLW